MKAGRTRAPGRRKAVASSSARQTHKPRSRAARRDALALHDFVRVLDDIQLPVDAHVIGEPVTVVQLFRHDDDARAGLRAACKRLGITYEVSLADVVFAAGTPGDALVTQYRTWLGLGLHGSAARKTRPHKVGDGEIVIGAPTDLVVLACRSNALHCRLLEGSRAITVRTAVRDEIPGAIITVVPTKQWTHARHPYLTGEITAMRFAP